MKGLKGEESRLRRQTAMFFLLFSFPPRRGSRFDEEKTLNVVDNK